MRHVIDDIELPAFPWVWHQQGDANDHVLLTSEKQWVIAFRTNGEFMPAKEEAIIRHIIASANACAGISTENLEDNIPVKELATRYNKALQQRDELLAALEGLHKVCEIALAGKNGKQHTYFETRSGHFVEASNAMQQAEASIAELKGGAA